MSGLSESDAVALMAAYCHHSDEGRKQLGHVGCEREIAALLPTVEAIAARHAAAAVEEFRGQAIAAIEAERDRYAVEDEQDECESRYCYGWLLGQTFAAQMIRDLTT